MRTLKVFVLVESFSNDEEVAINVTGVYSTKGAAEDKLQDCRDSVLDTYENTLPDDYEIKSDSATYFRVECVSDKDFWEEFSVTEREVQR